MSTPLARLKPEDLDAQSLGELDSKSFIVADPETDLPCRLKLLPDSRTLFVMLNGAVDRAKPLPVFARWNWGKILGGHVLAICDPTLYLDEKLRLGWFVGNRSIEPMKALLRTVEIVRFQLGIDDTRVIFYGSSGGGFASIIAAASRPVGRAMVVNPQTDINNYYPEHVQQIAKVFASNWTPDQCRTHYPLRWSVLEAIEAAKLIKNDLRIVYAQNLHDSGHYSRHFSPFCTATSSPIDGGTSVDGQILTYVYNSPEGHGAEPPDVVKYFVDRGLAHLLS